MRLYLVQHAEAKREEEDPSRPLSEKGLEDTRKVAKYAHEHLHIQADEIIHSGKLRAKQTAEVLADHLNPAKGVSVGEGLEPLADPKVWGKRLSEATANLMLVGHLPHLSRLAAQLLCGDTGSEVVAFKMAGIVCLEKDENDRWTLQWMVTPEILP
ncbi:MAG: phosphohistidine phosphatase SixA [Thaumarchaeota archaeon]|nr:phosphohistidine phosphatase SixA [Nitrososphaerota archaeon]